MIFYFLSHVIYAIPLASSTNQPFPPVLVLLALQAAWDSKQEVAVKGPIDSRHLYFDITNMQVRASNFTRAGKTCVGAMGWSFAAGTTDGEQGWEAPCSITLSSTAVIHVSMPKLHHPRRDGCIVFSTRIASYVTFLRMTAEHGLHCGGLLTAALPDQDTETALVCCACATYPGPGSPGFFQGDRNGQSLLYTPLSDLLNALFKAKPSKEQEECQHPKPILLNVGAALKPYPFVPAIVEVSLFHIGNLVRFANTAADHTMFHMCGRWLAICSTSTLHMLLSDHAYSSCGSTSILCRPKPGPSTTQHAGRAVERCMRH